jgi:iron complex outermembrane recepter protein
LGGRYGVDSASAFFSSLVAPFPSVTTPTKRWDSFTPRAVIRYSLTPDSNVYLSWSQGNKVGLFNSGGLLNQTTPVSPEKVTDIEGGYKISRPSWDLEVSGFHYDYTNLQIQVIIGTESDLENAARSEMYGFDFNFRKRFLEYFSFNVGGTYTHARYTDFGCPPNPSPTLVCGATVYSSVPSGAISVLTQQNESGNQMKRTPEFSGVSGLDFDHPLYGGSFQFYVNYSYQTRTYFDVNQGANQRPYGLLNLRAAWVDPSKHFTFSVNGQNVTNQKYLNQVLELTTAFAETFGPPASVFFEVAYKY